MEDESEYQPENPFVAETIVSAFSLASRLSMLGKDGPDPDYYILTRNSPHHTVNLTPLEGNDDFAADIQVDCGAMIGALEKFEQDPAPLGFSSIGIGDDSIRQVLRENIDSINTLIEEGGRVAVEHPGVSAARNTDRQLVEILGPEFAKTNNIADPYLGYEVLRTRFYPNLDKNITEQGQRQSASELGEPYIRKATIGCIAM